MSPAIYFRLQEFEMVSCYGRKMTGDVQIQHVHLLLLYSNLYSYISVITFIILRIFVARDNF